MNMIVRQRVKEAKESWFATKCVEIQTKLEDKRLPKDTQKRKKGCWQQRFQNEKRETIWNTKGKIIQW